MIVSQEEKKFEPINSNDIRIYACGPTNIAMHT